MGREVPAGASPQGSCVARLGLFFRDFRELPTMAWARRSGFPPVDCELAIVRSWRRLRPDPDYFTWTGTRSPIINFNAH